jgi:hypothetical protein
MRNNEHNDRYDSDFCEELSYQRLYDSSFYPTIPDNSKCLPTTASESFLSALECFVNDLLVNDEIPSRPYLGTDGRTWHTRASLAVKYFGLIPDFIEVVNRLPQRYEYSESINAFIACCHAMGLLREHLDWKNIWVDDPDKTYPCFGDVSAVEIFNRLVQAIRRECDINNLQAKVNARKKEVANQINDYRNYADSLFRDRARLVLVRVDLFYEKHYADSMDVFEMGATSI